MIINKFPIGNNNKKLPGFTYTGTYTVVDDGDDGWRIKFLTSGTFKVDRRARIDVFCVGGGGSGAYAKYESGVPSGWVGWSIGSWGGAGGYTETLKNVVISANKNYQIVVGAGGESVNAVDSTGYEPLYNPGSASLAFNCAANGGEIYNIGGNYGGDYGFDDPNNTPFLASNGGSDGVYITPDGSEIIRGTTREFGEPNGDLYAGGGGGAAGGWHNQETYGLGGAGGGGNGAARYSNAGNGGVNTGGGGGGGFVYFDSAIAWTGRASGAGGSGIVIIRNHRGD